ncbi:MAG: RNA-splicing ligase RtcB [Pseudomonadota bacterium]|jgi:tRNA-splicing ligase RtcB
MVKNQPSHEICAAWDSQISKPIQHGPTQVANKFGIDIKLFASPEVPLEEAAFQELDGMLELQTTVERLHKAQPGLFAEVPAIERIALTPDFHKAQGIPVGTVMATKGFVVPQAIGKDIGCGYQLVDTGLNIHDVEPYLATLGERLRHTFFLGGRDIPLSNIHRIALLEGGVSGLMNSLAMNNPGGIWNSVRGISDMIVEACGKGDERTEVPSCLSGYVKTRSGISRDNQIGSIGGGNHFVELQVVDSVFDATTAYAWGLRPGAVLVMIHSGSLNIGSVCAATSADKAKKFYQDHVPGRLPDNKLFPVPVGPNLPMTGEFMSAHYAARNFAAVNRLALALCTVETLARVTGKRTEFKPVYDSPHNYINNEICDGTRVFVHRKGASAGRGPVEAPKSEGDLYGEPVMLPGAMGVESYLMAGLGSNAALNSVSHGAGRKLRRSKAMSDSEDSANDFLARYQVIKPFDLNAVRHQASPKLLKNLIGDIKQEMPNAYKPIRPVMHALRDHGMAKPVLKVAPLMTAKG